MTAQRPGAYQEDAWLGYTFRELHQIAARATIYCRWGDRFPFSVRFEIAWDGVVDEVIVRVIAVDDTLEQIMDLLRAARPTA